MTFLDITLFVMKHRFLIEKIVALLAAAAGVVLIGLGLIFGPKSLAIFGVFTLLITLFIVGRITMARFKRR
jgi:hypothetical protein